MYKMFNMSIIRKTLKEIVNDETGMSLAANPGVIDHILKYKDDYKGDVFNLFMAEEFKKMNLSYMGIKTSHPRFKLINNNCG